MFHLWIAVRQSKVIVRLFGVLLSAVKYDVGTQKWDVVRFNQNAVITIKSPREITLFLLIDYTDKVSYTVRHNPTSSETNPTLRDSVSVRVNIPKSN